MCERKAWTKEEDQLLTKLMGEEGCAGTSRKLRWNDIAAKISELSPARARKGKQCRERWFNQLHPAINREAEWTPAEQSLLFSLQAEHGNRWARIARAIPGRSDNNIKNYFYSTLRKALRRVNNYVTFHKNRPCYKNVKSFQGNTLNKILTVAENKADRKVILGKQNANQLAKDLRDALIRVQMTTTEVQSKETDDFMDMLVASIQDFNRICKRRKSKKREDSSSGNLDEKDSISFHQEHSANVSLSPTHNKSFAFNTVTSFKAADTHPCPNKKPLRNSQEGAEQRLGMGFKQVESQPLAHAKAMRQPIIPALHSSNCLTTPSQNPSLSFEKAKDSQSLQYSGHVQASQSSAANLSFIPFLQQNYFGGSAFMPTPFFPRSFFGFETSPGHPGFALNWSHQYKCRQAEHSNPFFSSQQNVLQSSKRGQEVEKGNRME